MMNELNRQKVEALASNAVHINIEGQDFILKPMPFKKARSILSTIEHYITSNTWKEIVEAEDGVSVVISLANHAMPVLIEAIGAWSGLSEEDIDELPLAVVAQIFVEGWKIDVDNVKSKITPFQQPPSQQSLD